MNRKQTQKCEMKERFLPNLLYVAELTEQGQSYYPHQHKTLCEMVLIEEGTASFQIDAKNYTVVAGDLIVYNQNVTHSETYPADAPVKRYVIGINRVLLAGRGINCIIPDEVSPVVHLGEWAKELSHYFKVIVKEGISMRPGYEQICKGLLLTIFAIILRCCDLLPPEDEDSDSSLAPRISAFLEENYAHDITLNDIAAHFYISSYYLAHLMKKEFGISPIKQIMLLRMGEAQQLLLTTNYTITNICSMVGYENLNYFFYLFKRHTGLTPNQFRETKQFFLCHPEKKDSFPFLNL